MYHAENRHGVEMVEIKSSLALQMLVYYQGMFSVLYFFVSGGIILNKLYNYEFANGTIGLLLLPIFMLWSVTEVARVSLGYVGNIKERVPMISAFMLLTIFPQLVAVGFFVVMQENIFPFESVAGTVMILFLLVELYVGRRTLDQLIRRQTAQFFRLCQEEEFGRMQNVNATAPDQRDAASSRGAQPLAPRDLAGGTASPPLGKSRAVVQTLDSPSAVPAGGFLDDDAWNDADARRSDAAAPAPPHSPPLASSSFRAEDRAPAPATARRRRPRRTPLLEAAAPEEKEELLSSSSPPGQLNPLLRAAAPSHDPWPATPDSTSNSPRAGFA